MVKNTLVKIQTEILRRILFREFGSVNSNPDPFCLIILKHRFIVGKHVIWIFYLSRYAIAWIFNPS